MFTLGYEGELWLEGLGALAVPIPGSEKSILVVHYVSTNSYAIVTGDEHIFPDNILMVAGLVRHKLNTLGSKDGVQEGMVSARKDESS